MSDQQTDLTQETLDWLLTQFVENTDGAQDAIFASRDGLALACTLADTTHSEQWAALTTAVLSTASHLGRMRGVEQPVQQIVTELGDGSLSLVMSAGEGLPPWRATRTTPVQVTGCVLGVATSTDADPQVLGYAMTQFVTSISQHLVIPTRGSA